MILLVALVIVGGVLIAGLTLAAMAECVVRDAPPVIGIGVPFLFAEITAFGYALLLQALGLA